MKEPEAIIAIKLEEGGIFPKKAHPDSDAAYDLYANQDAVLDEGDVIPISVGFRMEIPEGWEAQIRSRSGLSAKYGVRVHNSPGTIDSGYRGEVKVILTKDTKKPNILGIVSPNAFMVKKGDRIAQMLIKRVPYVKLVEVNELSSSDRGEGGLGSTGVSG